MAAGWIESVGLLFGLATLITLALRGVNILLASVICALIVIFTNSMPLGESLSGHYISSKLGAFTFAGRFFFLFASGAMFGRIMAETHAATSIAMALVDRIGRHRALWITTLSSALLTYGGVVAFVVIFAMYPLGLRLLKEANIPKRLFCGALALGSGTFTMTALPGTPSIHNVIASVALGTDLFAGALLGIFGSLIMFVLGMWYLERERVKAHVAGESFVAGAHDLIPDLDSIATDLPPLRFAVLPLVAVIATIVVPRLLIILGLDARSPLLAFANTQPVLWPSIALVLGSLLALNMSRIGRQHPLRMMGAGARDSIHPLMNTAAVVGFGGVVVNTSGFEIFTNTILEADLPPLLSMFMAINMVSAVVGSSSGGLQIFMETMANHYIAAGIEPGVLHRLVTMSAGCFDSLPHCGAIIATLSIVGLTHREGYKDMGIISVVIPTIATMATIGLASFI